MIPLLQAPAPHTVAAYAVLLVLVALELAGRRVEVVLGVVGLVLADAVLYADVGSAGGMFRVAIPSGSVDLPTAAVFAVPAVRLLRWQVTGRPRAAGDALLAGSRFDQMPVAGLLWAGLLVWLAFAGVRGYLAGHPASNVVYQEFGLAQVVGATALVVGVSVRDLERSWRLLAGCAVGAALVAGGLLAATLLGQELTWSSDLVPASRLGTVGGDCASLFGLLGLVVLAVAVRLRAHRGPMLVCGLLISGVPFACTQRAALLGWGLGLVVLLAVFLVAQTGRRPWLPAATVVAGTAVVLVGIGGVAVTQLQGDAGPTVLSAFSSQYDGPAKQQSSQSRINQWVAAERLFAAGPWVGNGLATPYQYYEEGSREIVRGDITHDIYIDVAVRGGVVGLVLLLAAGACAVVGALRTALVASGGRAAVALAAGVALTALLTKGAVESVLEKPRLTVALGVLVGLVVVACRPQSGRTPPAALLPATLPALLPAPRTAPAARSSR